VAGAGGVRPRAVERGRSAPAARSGAVLSRQSRNQIG
jgi:hypothetical protein